MARSASSAIGEKWVHPDLVDANSWNPNRMTDFMYQKELASISRFGMVNPIIVRQVDDRYEVIDGEHRLKAAHELLLDSIPIWSLGDIPDTTAKQLTVVLNETRGSTDRGELSTLLRDLLTSEPTVELMAVLPFSEPDFQAIVDLPAFDWSTVEGLAQNDGKRDGWVERIYRMPHEAAEVLDQALAKVKADDEIPDWKALELMAADYLGG